MQKDNYADIFDTDKINQYLKSNNIEKSARAKNVDKYLIEMQAKQTESDEAMETGDLRKALNECLLNTYY